ncbi:MAG: acyl-CoA dehydratase activase [Clostridiales bacterium]|nr:acyl-CoA dehydratase activase [Clostridiales bacterium]
MVITAGIDIGSKSTEAVILRDDKLVGAAMLPTGADSGSAAAKTLKLALNSCGLTEKELSYIVSTGYGRGNLPAADEYITEITCHAKGSWWYFPESQVILDIGGQDCKAILCDAAGRVSDFAINDRCAAGTGRYLERAAELIGMPVDHMGSASLNAAEKSISLDGICIVYAEKKIRSLLRQGRSRNDIAYAACEYVANRVASLVYQVWTPGETFCMSGGVAHNIGVVKRLEAMLGVSVKIAPNPEYIGAVGAAVLAAERVAL